jgi:hypothetical protein
MKYPTQHYRGFTWVGWLNRLVFQWLWFRLQGNVEDNGDTKWALILPVAPLTGWGKRYWPTRRYKVSL